MLDIEARNGALVFGEQALKEMKALKEFQITLQEMQNEEDAIKEAILKAMEENGIKSYENEWMKITYIPEGERKSVDTARLKEEGLYEVYTKTSKTKAQVRITYR